MRCHGKTRISRPKVLCKLGSAYVNNTDISHMRRRGVATCEGRYCSNTKHASGMSKCHRVGHVPRMLLAARELFSPVSPCLALSTGVQSV